MTPKHEKERAVAESLGDYQINWALIEQQCKEAAIAVKKIQQLEKEPDVKKKNGKKKKGY
jgi:hypothetical protein